MRSAPRSLSTPGSVTRRPSASAGRPRLIDSSVLGPVASLCATEGGRSVDPTMGFTPREGLVMATRAGSIDPGLLLWVQRYGGLTADEVREALEERSGLVG